MLDAAFDTYSTDISALYQLETSLKPGSRASGISLLHAVQKDITSGVAISKVLFMKQVISNPAIETEELKAILEVCKLAIVSQIEANAQASLSYAHAAILCSTEIHSR